MIINVHRPDVYRMWCCENGIGNVFCESAYAFIAIIQIPSKDQITITSHSSLIKSQLNN